MIEDASIEMGEGRRDKYKDKVIEENRCFLFFLVICLVTSLTDTMILQSGGHRGGGVALILLMLLLAYLCFYLLSERFSGHAQLIFLYLALASALGSFATSIYMLVYR